MNQHLLQFAYLQLLDLMTTLAFLTYGVEEANPVVRFAMQHTGNPLEGLILLKTAALAMGGYCWMRGRLKVLSRVNVLFAVVVAWNLAALIAGSVRGLA